MPRAYIHRGVAYSKALAGLKRICHVICHALLHAEDVCKTKRCMSAIVTVSDCNAHQLQNHIQPLSQPWTCVIHVVYASNK